MLIIFCYLARLVSIYVAVFGVFYLLLNCVLFESMRTLALLLMPVYVAFGLFSYFFFSHEIRYEEAKAKQKEQQ